MIVSFSNLIYCFLYLVTFQIFVFLLDDIVAIFKPYGIPMFGDSKNTSFHSVEKYQNVICEATKAEKLYEVSNFKILLFIGT